MSTSIHRIRRIDGIAGQVCYEATVRYEDEQPDKVTFAGSIYGGPVIMIGSGGQQTFVTDPDRFGQFNERWIERFFA